MNTTEQQTYTDKLILSYLNGELDDSTRNELEKWINTNEANKKQVYEVTEIWLASTIALGKAGNEKAAYLRFKNRTNKYQTTINHFPFRYVAASLLIGVFLGIAGFSFTTKQPKGKEIEKETAGIQTIEVPVGSRSHIILADGTSVWLNTGSKLTYKSDFSSTTRDVSLEGEGYFEVTPNKTIPFIVHTSNIQVKVLGTKFNVKAYSNDKDISVALAEGAVKFSTNKDPLNEQLMQPEEQITYNMGTGKTTMEKVPAHQISNWTRREILFDEQSFESIAGQLEKTFNVTIHFKDETKKKLHFYGDFRQGESIVEILTIMSASKKFQYKISRGVIEIY